MLLKCQMMLCLWYISHYLHKIQLLLDDLKRYKKQRQRRFFFVLQGIVKVVVNRKKVTALESLDSIIYYYENTYIHVKKRNLIGFRRGNRLF